MSVTLKNPSAAARMEFYAKPASTAFVADTLVSGNEDATSNTFVAATAAKERVLGVLTTTIAATDADYASETKVPVQVDELGLWEFDVGTGTADVNDEQGYVDLTDAAGVDVTASTIDMVFVVNFVSGTKVQGRIVRWNQTEPPATN